MKIGIVILCTNAYLPLGIRLVKRFNHFYKGENEIKFYLFTDKNPSPYLPDNFPYEWRELKNSNWVDGTNAKFTSILGVDEDYIFYFDADTNIVEDFGDWFIGDLVGGQHFGDQTYMINEKPYERNPKSMAYIPKTTSLPQMYYYGAFFGGKRERVIDFCKVLTAWQGEDKSWGYEPVWNDESYIQRYFHYEPPKVILCKDFPFIVSDKGGIENTRNTNLDVDRLKADLRKYRDMLVDIRGGEVILDTKK